MAGYVLNQYDGVECDFHIDTSNVGERIRATANGRRIITLQLDGDELDAALWGLDNYKKEIGGGYFGGGSAS